MKLISYAVLYTLGTGCSGLMMAATPEAAAPDKAVVNIINARFEAPTERTRSYPPPKGEGWGEVAGMGGWTNDGQFLLTYAGGYGLDGSGGIYGKVVKPATKFMSLSYNNVKFPMLKDSLPLVDPLRSLKFSADAKLPLGKTFEVNIQFNVPKDVDVGSSTWSNRIVFGNIRGTGNYEHYEFTTAEMKEKNLMVIVNYLRDLYLNGMTEVVGSLNFNFTAADWSEADEFLLDNIKVTIAGSK